MGEINPAELALAELAFKSQPAVRYLVRVREILALGFLRRAKRWNERRRERERVVKRGRVREREKFVLCEKVVKKKKICGGEVVGRD